MREHALDELAAKRRDGGGELLGDVGDLRCFWIVLNCVVCFWGLFRRVRREATRGVERQVRWRVVLSGRPAPSEDWRRGGRNRERPVRRTHTPSPPPHLLAGLDQADRDVERGARGRDGVGGAAGDHLRADEHRRRLRRDPAVDVAAEVAVLHAHVCARAFLEADGRAFFVSRREQRRRQREERLSAQRIVCSHWQAVAESTRNTTTQTPSVPIRSPILTSSPGRRP